MKSSQERYTVFSRALVSEHGLKGDDALHAVRAIRSMLDGFAMLESNGSFGLALDVDESFRRLLRAYSIGLRAGVA